eukprot:scaffold1872_cov251-Prasinococcus_capsulatus_cf.AAC.2
MHAQWPRVSDSAPCRAGEQDEERGKGRGGDAREEPPREAGALPGEEEDAHLRQHRALRLAPRLRPGARAH